MAAATGFRLLGTGEREVGRREARHGMGAMAGGAGRIVAGWDWRKGQARVEAMLAGRVFVAGRAVNRFLRGLVRQLFDVETLMTVDAFQRAMGGLGEEGLVGKERHQAPGLFRLERRVAVALKTGGGGVGGGPLGFFHWRVCRQGQPQAEAAKHDEHPRGDPLARQHRLRPNRGQVPRLGAATRGVRPQHHHPGCYGQPGPAVKQTRCRLGGMNGP